MLMMLMYWVEAYIPYKKKKTEPLLFPIKENGLKVNADKTKCMFMSVDQNAGRSRGTKIYNSCLKGWKSSNIWE
jgi:hypothetical protein